MKKIAILGSTGSIGTQTLEVVRNNPELQVAALAAGKSVEQMEQQIREFHPLIAGMWSEEAAADLRSRVADLPVKVVSGMDGLLEIATMPQSQVLVTAIVGMIGIRPTIAAIEAGKDIALANKETLVTAGHIIMPLAAKMGVKILPVDSEHSAIYQCLGSRAPANVERLILTASGGPFRKASPEEMKNATWERALAHPTWSMGQKVTIDSATLMNKALEMVEASFLFDCPEHRIDVVIHPQSIVHSMVEFTDGVIMAQMSVPDMRFPIQYAFTCPERCPGGLEKLNLSKVGKLEFEAPDTERFPSLGFAREALRAGGTMPCVMNAANEVAFERFRKGGIGFTGIWNVIEKTMQAHRTVENAGLDDILEADRWARVKAASIEVNG